MLMREKSCGALVYYKSGEQIELLIIKHRLGEHWAFPKGHVEKGETEIETALREVKEETGLAVRLLSGYRKRVVYFPKKNVEKEVIYFLGSAEHKNTTKQEEEISEIRWVPIEQGENYLTYRNDQQLLQSAKKVLRKKGILPTQPPKGS